MLFQFKSMISILKIIKNVKLFILNVVFFIKNKYKSGASPSFPKAIWPLEETALKRPQTIFSDYDFSPFVKAPLRANMMPHFLKT